MILDSAAEIAHWTAAGWWGRTTIDDLFRACVVRFGDRLALADPPNRADLIFDAPQRLTFAELDVAVDKLAAELLALGVRKDSVVLVQLPNIVEIVISFLACARLGAIISPVALSYGVRDIRRIIDHLRPAAVITLSEFKGARPDRVAAGVCAELGFARPAIMAFGRQSQAGVRTVEGIDGLSGDRARLTAYLADLSIDANDILTMHWTSGTTGDPKCVPRSHNTWHATGGCCVDAGGLLPGDRILAPMQMVHTAGMSGVFMPWLETQGMIALHLPFDMDIYLDQIESLRINHTVAAPAMLNALLKRGSLEHRDVSSIRSILCGSAPLDAWMIEGFKSRHGIEIINAFGSTEGLTLLSGPTITGDAHRRARYFPRFRGAASRAFAGGETAAESGAWGIRIAVAMETRLRDMDSGDEISAPGRPGELLFRSPALFPGYWVAGGGIDRLDFDADGFFRAGEIFEIAGEGVDADYFHYIDRLKDVINRGGVKIPVGELEAAIHDHPKVLEAAAIGYPDERIGERICAVVVLIDGATLELDELIEDLRTREIPRYMHPERLEIVKALPRNAVGKVMKRELVKMLNP